MSHLKSLCPCKFWTGVMVIFGWTDEVFREPPFQMNTMNVMSPFSFKDWLDKQRPSLANGGPIDMFGAQFETEVPGCYQMCFHKSFTVSNHGDGSTCSACNVLCCYNAIMLHLMIMTGNGVWTWADTDVCTAKWCVDLANGMFCQCAVPSVASYVQPVSVLFRCCCPWVRCSLSIS